MVVAILIALAAIFANAPAAEFAEGVMAYCVPHFEPGVFIGCEAADPTQDEYLYAGMIWVENEQGVAPMLVTGP